jgi:hypothetical protein
MCLAALTAAAGPALAIGPVGKDPASNFKIGRLPLACETAPTSAGCVNGAVYWLDRARARLHQGPYKLPADFTKLNPAKQAFILTNLDRIQYGLTPITGLTRQADGWAMTGVRDDRDPVSTDPLIAGPSNWAGAFSNIDVAYEIWMYDDGYGSNNLDCTSPHAAGCWGHRHTVLFGFGPGGRLAMGAAAGRDRSGAPGYALFLGRGAGAFKPTYYYTWSQAVAAGAGKNTYVAHRPAALGLVLKAHGLKLIALVSTPAKGARCQISKRVGKRWSHSPFEACYSGEFQINETSSGRYRFRLKADGRTLTRYITLHRH